MNVAIPCPENSVAVVAGLTAVGECNYMYVFHDGHPSLLGASLINNYNSCQRIAAPLKSDVPLVDYWWWYESDELASIQVDFDPGELETRELIDGFEYSWARGMDDRGTLYGRDLASVMRKLLDDRVSSQNFTPYVYFFTGMEWRFVRVVYGYDLTPSPVITLRGRYELETDPEGNYVWRDLDEYLFAGNSV